MNSIFGNAYFGKPYKTRNSKKAIYAGKLPAVNLHRLLVEDLLDTFNYNEFGSFRTQGESQHDIVSEWQEIDEEELDKLANEYEDRSGLELGLNDIHDAYKAGYRKAKGK